MHSDDAKSLAEQKEAITLVHKNINPLFIYESRGEMAVQESLRNCKDLYQVEIHIYRALIDHASFTGGGE